MALKARDEIHANQISAGTQGRIKGHQFEAEVTKELNELDLSLIHILFITSRCFPFEKKPFISNLAGRKTDVYKRQLQVS